MWFRSPFGRSKTGSTPPVVSRRLSVEPLDERIVPAALSVTDATITEGHDGVRSALVSVNLNQRTNKTVTVNYATVAGTAQAGSDYQSVSGKLTFASGETHKTIAVPVYGDLQAENHETVLVNLSGAKGATIRDGQGVVKIVDDEPRIKIEGVAWQEYSGGWNGNMFPFQVRLTAPSTEVVTVDFATADGAYNPVSGNSDPNYFATVAGNDYVATSGTLTFAPGETYKTIWVEVLLDDISEYDEYFFVNLSGATGGYVIDNDQAIGWILDDDSGGPGGGEYDGPAP